MLQNRSNPFQLCETDVITNYTTEPIYNKILKLHSKYSKCIAASPGRLQAPQLSLLSRSHQVREAVMGPSVDKPALV